MRIETGITKNRIIAELARSPHGKLTEYVSIGQQAAKAEPESSPFPFPSSPIRSLWTMRWLTLRSWVRENWRARSASPRKSRFLAGCSQSAG